METKLRNRLLSVALLLLFALPASAQSITFTTTKNVGDKVKLAITANGAVTATGLTEKIVADGEAQTYTLTAQTIKIEGADIQEFDCSGNKINALELSKCDNLSSLYCFDNEITKLDVSACAKLWGLYCGNNALTELNVSGCTKLGELFCFKNKLTSLDVSSCTELTEFSCYTNQLTSLDVSGHGKLSEFNCYSNKLTDLSIASCNGLLWLACEENHLSCEKMEKVMQELPQRTSYFMGSFNALTDAEKNATEGERNILTKDNVQVAVSKNWDVFSVPTAGSYTHTAFEGLEGTCADYQPKANITLTTTKEVGTTIKLKIKANGAVTAQGIKEDIVFDMANDYTLTAQTVTLSGDMTFFDCHAAQVSALSLDCTNLSTFSCEDNQLKELDVSKCPNLSDFWCYKNQLTQLNVSGCSKLDYINCSKNQLSSLDISSCGVLRVLYCHGNALTKLDLSQCPKLKELRCHQNKLTELDLTTCANLEKLTCAENKLTALDVSQCTKLFQVWCYDNQIASLDMSKCSNLEWLIAYKNRLTSVNLSGCEKFSFISCEENLLGCSALEAIADALPDRTSLAAGALDAVTADERNVAPGSGNVLTQHAAEVAKEKNWYVHYLEAAGSDNATDYDGRGGNCTDNAFSFVVTVSKDANGLVTVKGTKDLNAVPYNTELTVEVAPEAGYELDKLMANEEDITATKRFVVKSNVKVTATFKNGAESVAREGIALYPNPASDEANLFGVAPQSEVSVYGTDGAQLLTITADQSGHAVLRLEGLPEGNYLVTFRDAMGVLTTRQLTIKR